MATFGHKKQKKLCHCMLQMGKDYQERVITAEALAKIQALGGGGGTKLGGGANLEAPMPLVAQGRPLVLMTVPELRKDWRTSSHLPQDQRNQ
jgi:hypothetical protein